jgi:YVTN family beta-propeller protein
MYNNKGLMGSRAARARGFAGAGFYGSLRHAGGGGLGLMTRPAEAAPFAYVVNAGSNTVSVIDTATTLPSLAQAVALIPDGKHAYVTLFLAGSVYVIDTASNTVVGTPIPVEGSLWDRDYPGRETRLCRERVLQQRVLPQ